MEHFNCLDDKRIIVIGKSSTGRNILFFDPLLFRIMTREEFVCAIGLGFYPGYHIRAINGVDTPCSNPDDTTVNNLGYNWRPLCFQCDFVSVTSAYLDCIFCCEADICLAEGAEVQLSSLDFPAGNGVNNAL